MGRRVLRLLAALSLVATAACGAQDESESTTEQTRLTSGGDDHSCGGFAGLACAEGLTCVDKAGDECDPAHGGRDCIGTCKVVETKKAAETTTPVAETAKSCGGFAGTLCDEGEDCVDDASDDCDPKNGGFDCLGVCAPAKR